jgi:pilus assembly protein FimV
MMEAAPVVVAAPQSAQPNPASAQRSARKTGHMKVGAKATLRGIAWRVGERSEADIEKTMIAIFRANPAAFDGNINRLHRGATLTIPSRAEAALISLTDARREIQAQMAAWHSPSHALAANTAVPAPVAPASTAPAPVAVTDTPAPDMSAPHTSTPSAATPSPDAQAVVAAAALDHRIESLEQALSRMQGLMQSERDQLVALQRQTARAAVAAPAAVTLPAAVADPRTQLKSLFLALISIVASFAVVGAVLAAAYFNFRRRLSTARDSRLVTEPERADAQVADEAPAAAIPAEPARDDAQVPAPDSTQADGQIQAADIEATHPALPMLRISAAGRSEVSSTPLPGDSLDDTVVIAAPNDTVNLMVDTVNLRMGETHLDYNFLDLEQTAQHVQMPSVLNQNAVVKERRTNLADVLKMAIEREPDRHDLRMKLIELYYSAAATNRKAFLEVVHKLSRERDHMPPEQWDKIAFMGRQIAAENPLFTEQADDEDLADCA